MQGEADPTLAVPLGFLESFGFPHMMSIGRCVGELGLLSCLLVAVAHFPGEYLCDTQSRSGLKKLQVTVLGTQHISLSSHF